MTEARHKGLQQRIAHANAMSRLIPSLLIGVLVALFLPSQLSRQVRAVASWDAFALTALVMTWTTILTLQPKQILNLAQREDPGRPASLVMVLLGASASLLAVIVLLQESVKMVSGDKIAAIMLALSAVALAWTLIHTVFTLRYAHLYYDPNAGERALEFPGNPSMPDYLDFAYFAFVVGMTAQTADVNICDRRIRRMALLHGLVSFVFNTAVVALSIGVLTTLL